MPWCLLGSSRPPVSRWPLLFPDRFFCLITKAMREHRAPEVSSLTSSMVLQPGRSKDPGTMGAQRRLARGRWWEQGQCWQRSRGCSWVHLQLVTSTETGHSHAGEDCRCLTPVLTVPAASSLISCQAASFVPRAGAPTGPYAHAPHDLQGGLPGAEQGMGQSEQD